MNTEARIKALADTDCTIKVNGTIELQDATMYLVECTDDYGTLDTSVIIYNDGTLFHLRDWQSGNPTTPEEIEDYDWVTEGGSNAIIFDGMPRIL